MTDDCQRHSRYRFHRLALAPLVASNPSQALHGIRDELPATDENLFLRFLLDNGLAPLWHELLSKGDCPAPFSPEGLAELYKAYLSAAASYLRQQHTLGKITDVFAAAAIPHAVFKGVHIRGLIYDNPAVRHACDIDILVARENRVRAIQALLAAGFSFHPEAANISHEGHLATVNAALDLHWDILRPGRTRVDLTDVLLAEKEQFPDHWGLSSEATLFIMLVHPVFTKYSTTPQASLIRMIDLVRWTRSRRIDWDKVASYLERGGVKTAGWITATWLTMLTGISLPESFTNRIKPGKTRAWYLRKWLKNNLPTRLLNYPALVQTGFTLPAHDTWQDAWRATLQVLHEKKEASKKTEDLLQAIDKETSPMRRK